MNLQHRSYKKELLDGDDISLPDVKRNMQELDIINTWLGGHTITIAGLKKLLAGRKEITICEIGCGGGDNLAAIAKWCRKKDIQLHCIGIDIKPACIKVAMNNKYCGQHSKWIISDYRHITFANKPGIIFSSLFCHHFSEAELIQQLQWMYDNSTIGFFINDLHRHRLAYYSIKILTAVFSSSYLVKNDAPLSVARGLTRKEWQYIFNSTPQYNYTITWKWAFRFLITCRHNEQ
ncbi:MAG TPA: methyltransferase domain-containing protein [Chitinophagaceae bacterium]|nr:methyltransferase domain-containing protein [Chitinophagaceae bacterium]